MRICRFRSAVARAGLLSSAMLVLLGCGGDDPAGPDRGATQLAFLTEPVTVEAGAAIDPAVVIEVRDASGRRVADAELPVTLSLGQSPDGAALSGTKTVRSAGGVASFSGLSLDSAAASYTLTAQTDNLSGAESAPFEVMPGPPASLAVSPTPARLNAIGDTLQLEATVRDRLGNAVAGLDVAWSSADPNVATVDESGRVVSVAEGEVMITAAGGNVEGEITLEVEQVAATVAVSPAADTLAEGETLELVAVVVDSNGVEMADVSVEWASGLPAVAVVASTGPRSAVVTANRGSPVGIEARVDAISGQADLYVLRKIAFVSDRDGSTGNYNIYLMNEDGSGQTRLTEERATDIAPVELTWSPNGERIAFRSDLAGHDDIHVMNADGSGRINLTGDIGIGRNPAWSPDGGRIAYSRTRDVYVMNADGSDKTNLTNNDARASHPAWSPDGSRIAFTSNGGTLRFDIYVMNADGSGQTHLTAEDDGGSNPVWSPDSESIVFGRSSLSGSMLIRRLYVMNADGSGQTPLTPEDGDDYHDVDWSPDGRKIAFASRREGNSEIYLVNRDGSGLTQLTSLVGSHTQHPQWSPDGRRILFLHDFEIYVMTSDGSEQSRLTDRSGYEMAAAWRPDPLP